MKVLNGLVSAALLIGGAGLAFSEGTKVEDARAYEEGAGVQVADPAVIEDRQERVEEIDDEDDITADSGSEATERQADRLTAPSDMEQTSGMQGDVEEEHSLGTTTPIPTDSTTATDSATVPDSTTAAPDSEGMSEGTADQSLGGATDIVEETEPEAPADQNQDSDVRMAQRVLSQQGFDVQVDGVLGENTKQALRNFQEQQGIEATGELDQRTLAALRQASTLPAE